VLWFCLAFDVSVLLMGFALLYPSYVECCGFVGFVGWVERSETHQFKLAVIEDQQARYRHADTRWVNRVGISCQYNLALIR
jgi:cytochrome c oxidase assembly protein Cox11